MFEVSWIRLRDWHILSTGPSTFTQDERFTVRHTPGDNDWSLAIKFVKERDQGVYVCQVSTSTGSLSHYYNLAIIVPRAFILGADEYYAMAGGDISLVCIIEDVSCLNILTKTWRPLFVFRPWSRRSMFTGITTTR